MKNFLREKLDAGQMVLGTWSLIPSITSIEIIARTGLDFIILDGEHGPFSPGTMQSMAIACEAHQVSPVVRISGIDSHEMSQALDLGAHCVHVPNISTSTEAEQCVQMFKYPPLGGRGLSPFARAGGYGNIPSCQIIDEANRALLLAVHIEDSRGIQNIHNILTIKEIDIIFIGLFDLSKSLGVPGEISHPRVLELLHQLTQQIADAGKHPGTIVMNYEQLTRAMDYGVRYITYSVDSYMLSQAYQSVKLAFKEEPLWN